MGNPPRNALALIDGNDRVRAMAVEFVDTETDITPKQQQQIAKELARGCPAVFRC